jgi:hypothetical protein
VKGKKPFGALFREYARRKGVDVASLRFLYLFRPLRHDETPKSVMSLPLIEDGCIQAVFLGRELHDTPPGRALARRRVGKSEDLAAKQDAAAKRALDAIYARAARETGGNFSGAYEQ